MRGALVLAVVASVLATGCVSVKANVTAPVSVNETKSLRHVVLFKWKDGTSPEQIAVMEKAFYELSSKIPAIKGFEWGTNVSVENLSQGFTHCFVVTFQDEAGRGEYLPHPAHKEFVELVGPYLEKALVVDYWAQK